MFSSQSNRFDVPKLMKRCLATMVVLTTSLTSAYGAVIYATGFEAPTFTLGSINSPSQDGWAAFNPTDSFDAVQNVFVKSGTQAAWVIPVKSSNAQTGMFHNNPTAALFINLSADIFLASSSAQNGWQFAGLGSGLFPFIGGIDVFADNSIHLITSGFTSAGTFARDVWNHVDFVFDMTTQTYTFSLNNVSVATGVRFCGDNGPCAGAAVSSYGTTFFDVFATLNSNDLGAIDNLSLSSVSPTATPEPTSVLLIASGLTLLMTRRYWMSLKG